jgi:spore photoproduct lyase
MDESLHEQVYRDTLLPALEAEDQAFLRTLADQYRLDIHEVQTLATAARDLEMWRETPLASLWSDWEAPYPDFLSRLEAHMERLRHQEKIYPTDPLRGLTHAPPITHERPAPTRVFTLCPYFSADTNCCRLHIIEAVTGCALGCSFCNISASMGETIEFSADLAERLAELELDAERFYHVSTSHMSDSLVWGNRHGLLDALFAFARRNPHVQLELKTRSDRVDYLLHHRIPPNIVVSWWLNTDTLIRNEEHGTAPLHNRFEAARLLQDRGAAIGFHINPMILYRGWHGEYTSLVGQLMTRFSPDEIEFLSLGVLWLSPPVVRGIRHRGGESKVLQMPLIADPGDRLTYPQETRVEMYSGVRDALKPWGDQVYLFLCMETPAVWEAVFGDRAPVGERLEQIFRRRLRQTGDPTA